MTQDGDGASAHYNPDPHAHPGLHIVAIVEGVKAVLALMGATGLAVLGPAPLQRWMHALIFRFQFDPDHGAMAWFANSISPHSVHLAVLAVYAYGFLHTAEAWGLWHARAWASWLGCVAAALYLPFDIYALVRHPHWLAWTVVVINVLVVWVLGRDLVKRKR